MFSTAVIVFREFLEVALVLGLVMAATRGLPGRGKLAFAGLGIGLSGSLVVAFFTDAISRAVDGAGQELFNAAVMFIAVGFLGWTVVWMRRHGRELAGRIGGVGRDVMQGDKPAYALASIIALATFREGAEVALFTYGLSASGQYSAGAILAGGLLGALGGAATGFMLYFGLLKTLKRHLFTVTGWLLIFLTAGMAAQGAGFLIAADVLPELSPQVWDTSWLISGHSLVGKTLGTMVGYTPRPTGMELAFYVGVLLTVGTGYRMSGKTAAEAKPA
jgi:high-affinity iron transporter